MRTAAFLPASLLTAALAMTSSPRASAEMVVKVDKDAQSMTVTVDGQQLYVWPVSTGRPGNDTPNGTFRPNRMDADHLSQEWDNAPMPHSIFFDLRGHAIHGFLDANHIGNPASHGCVRLAPANAAVLFDLVKTQSMKETKVVISGRTPSLQSLIVARRHTLVEANAVLPDEFVPHSSERPSSYSTAPSAYVQEAAAYQAQPVTYEKLQQQAAYGQQPAANAQRPPAGAPQPAAYSQQPAASARQAAASRQAYYRQTQLHNELRLYYLLQPYYGQPLYYGPRLSNYPRPVYLQPQYYRTQTPY
jgi:L,D-transpeptidase catalytic domain